METINLHVVVPMNHQLVAVGFPYLHFKMKQESRTVELIVPSADHNPIDIKFQNLPIHHYMKAFLEKYASLTDAPHLSEEEKKKSWFLNVDQVFDIEAVKQWMGVMLRIWLEHLYHFSPLNRDELLTLIEPKGSVSVETTTGESNGRPVSVGTATGESNGRPVTVGTATGESNGRPVTVEPTSDYVPGEGSWTNGD